MTVKDVDVKAELFYFEGCPSYRQALENLRQALREEQLPEHVDLVRVEDAMDAESKRFIGSPTIRLDGIDVEGPHTDQRGHGFGCRVYAADGGMTGWPSVEQIRRALRRAG